MSCKASSFIQVGATNTYSGDFLKLYILTVCVSWGQVSLTNREREILKYIAEDKRNKEIADLLGISVRTVQAHRTNLMDKLGARDRTELVKYAIRKGIIDL